MQQIFFFSVATSANLFFPCNNRYKIWQTAYCWC